MPRPGKDVRFLVDYSPHGRTSAGPHYVKGEIYDLELSYADKYIRLGKAEDAAGAKVMETETLKLESEAPKVFAPVHRGFGKWDVVGPDDAIVATDLNKHEAKNKADELNKPQA